ncbi:MAG: SDR family oxidoreductase [Clostridiales bacterium]|nr:SDR family oxidoreductase [Clostridiales bacterium]
MKTAIITGASRGIGKACAIGLAKAGYTVVINYSRSKEEAEKVLATVKENGGDGMIYCADVTDKKQVNEMIRTVDKTYGGIDLLVNNAGIVKDEFLLMLNTDNLDKCFDLNVKAYFYCAQAAALKMFRKKSGVIINMSSVSGEMALAGQSVYSATKGAVNSLTRVLARELGEKGIRVNAVAPGFIQTEMTHELPADKVEEYIKAIPMHRFGTPEEVANVVVTLASDACSYVTGQVITLDGGLSL